MVTVLTGRPISASHRKNFSSTPLLVLGFGVLDSVGSAGTHAFIDLINPFRPPSINHSRFAAFSGGQFLIMTTWSIHLLNNPIIAAFASVLKCKLKPTTAADVSTFTSSLSDFTANTVKR